MSDINAKIKEYFNALVPKLVSHLRDDFDKFEYEFSQPENSIFASGIYFLTIKLWIKNDNKNKDKKESKTTIMRFLAKTSITTEAVQQIANLQKHFHNEIMFYRNYATENDNYPKCIYIEVGGLHETSLILEDVSNRGYALHPQKINLPMDDILVVMKEIGRFHAKGYIMKEQQPEKFFNLINDIQECRYSDDDQESSHHFKYLINSVGIRPVVYLRKHNYNRNVCDKLEEFLKDAYNNITLKTIKPVEPLAVFCHGDFTINNMLFNKNEKEAQVLLIDFALIRYSSPTIDLSTFLCLSCINQVKYNNISMVLRAYHDELTRCLKENGLTDLDKYSYEAFYNDYVENALFGYTIATFFLHMLVNKNFPKIPDVMDKSIEEISELAFVSGDDEVSKLLADLLLDLKELGCFNHVLS
ncbi:uncharacterized protein LOC122520938 [Polistes fuscatus]|uniref:uncharacterized protein LOC122520938 n=1 Tax=Polistes fuscatus TaxID=30207 RepID=UPI001CA94CD0|nr:uncharacterized protein LOC122520938 [Polistes fuscatus]